MELHILLAGVEFGPYTTEKARQLLGEGFLSRGDPAKRLDSTEWMPLSDLLAQMPAPEPAAANPAAVEHTPAPSPEPELTESEDRAADHAAAPPVQEPAPTPEPVESSLEPETALVPETARAAQSTPTLEQEPSFFDWVARRSPSPAAAPVEETFLAPVTTATTFPRRSPAVSTPPSPVPSGLLRVVSSNRAKKATRTGSLLAQEALQAARAQAGTLAPVGSALVPAATASVLAAPASPAPVKAAPVAPAAPPKRTVTAPVPEVSAARKKPLILTNRDETAPLTAPPTALTRKSIKLTGRITLPGAAPRPESPPSASPLANTNATTGPLPPSGPLFLGQMARRAARGQVKPLIEAPMAPTTKMTPPTGLKPAPGVTPMASTTKMAPMAGATRTAPVAPPPLIPRGEKPAAPPSPSKSALMRRLGEAPKQAPPGFYDTTKVKTATEPVEGDTLLRAAGTETVAEPFEDDPAVESDEPATEPDLSARGGLLTQSGDVAERRSLKITGPLRHPVPRAPIRLSSPKVEDMPLAQPASERPPTSALPTPEALPLHLPSAPVPEEELPMRPATGKIPVEDMPSEGVRVRTPRRPTGRVQIPDAEALASEAPPLAPPAATPVPQPPPPPEALRVPASNRPIALTPPPSPDPAAPAEKPASVPPDPTSVATAATAEAITETGSLTKTRARRPVKLELTSRPKIQDSGRLTLEAFSKMASIPAPTAPAVSTTPPATTSPIRAPASPPVPARTKAIPPATAPTPAAEPVPKTKVAPAEKIAAEPAARGEAAFHPSPGADEAVPRTRARRPAKPRWEWLFHVVISLGVIATCVIIYLVTHHATPGEEETAAAPETTTAPATNDETAVPPASAAPPSPATVPETVAPAPTPAPTAVAPTPAPAPAITMAAAPTNAAPPAPTPATPPPGAHIEDLNRQVEAYVGDGILKYQHTDYPAALASYNEALALDPHSAPALYNRGITKNAQGDLDGAIADYSAAIAAQPNMGPAYYYRGLVRHSRGELDGAISDYNAAVQVDPKNALAFFNRGLIRMQKDDLDGAVADATRALDLDPSLVQSYYDRGLGRLARGELPEALNDMRTFCQIDPQDNYTDYARLYIWIIQSGQGHVAEATQELSKAMNNGWNGGPESMVTRLGEYLLGQISEAELLKSAVSNVPLRDQGQHCEAWYFIGMRRLLTGDRAGGVADLNKCVATQKSDYCEFILAQEALKNVAAGSLGANAPPVPRAQAVTMPDPGTVAPPSDR